MIEANVKYSYLEALPIKYEVLPIAINPIYSEITFYVNLGLTHYVFQANIDNN